MCTLDLKSKFLINCTCRYHHINEIQSYWSVLKDITLVNLNGKGEELLPCCKNVLGKIWHYLCVLPFKSHCPNVHMSQFQKISFPQLQQVQVIFNMSVKQISLESFFSWEAKKRPRRVTTEKQLLARKKAKEKKSNL